MRGVLLSRILLRSSRAAEAWMTFRLQQRPIGKKYYGAGIDSRLEMLRPRIS